jgi:sucrose-6-phosphate hydrolase SacC (GH32 family)
MAVYDETDKKRWIAFYTSPNLKEWTYRSRIEGFYECPDLFELPIDGDASNRKWVLTAADSNYMVGSFDGETFKPETEKLKGNEGKGFNAAQTFTNAPGGRVIQIGWLQAPSPGMPFNQAMSIPMELNLITTEAGVRLTHRPAAELSSLRRKTPQTIRTQIKPGDDPLKDITGDLVEIRAAIVLDPAATMTFKIRGVEISYDTAKQELTVAKQKATVPIRNGSLTLVILADRTVYEVFAADGLIYMPVPVIPKAEEKSLSLTSTGAAKIDMAVYEMESVWKAQ